MAWKSYAPMIGDTSAAVPDTDQAANVKVIIQPDNVAVPLDGVLQWYVGGEVTIPEGGIAEIIVPDVLQYTPPGGTLQTIYLCGRNEVPNIVKVRIITRPSSRPLELHAIRNMFVIDPVSVLIPLTGPIEVNFELQVMGVFPGGAEQPKP
jgi:hypothetical protein